MKQCPYIHKFLFFYVASAWKKNQYLSFNRRCSFLLLLFIVYVLFFSTQAKKCEAKKKEANENWMARETAKKEKRMEKYFFFLTTSINIFKSKLNLQHNIMLSDRVSSSYFPIKGIFSHPIFHIHCFTLFFSVGFWI